MAGSSSPTLPSIEEVSYPGRVLARSGVSSDIPKAGLRLGELAFTSDNYCGWLGDESQNPPRWPTSKTVGDFDWSNLNPTFKNMNVTTINGKDLTTLIQENIKTGPNPVITIINDVITKKVYGAGADFVDFDEAFAWLSQRTISSRGFVTLQLAAGNFPITKKIIFQHPNGNRIAILGATLKTALPKNTEYQITGNSALQQINDKAVNIDKLRRAFSTVFECSSGGCFEINSDLSILKDVLVVSDGANAPGTEVTRGLLIGNSISAYQRVAVVGFNLYNFYAYNSTIYLRENFITMGSRCGIASSSYSLISLESQCETAILSVMGNGVEVTNASFVSIPYENVVCNVRIAGCGESGAIIIQGVFGSKIRLVAELNSGYGLNISSRSSATCDSAIIRNNGQGSIYVSTLCDIAFPNLTATGPGYGIFAAQGSYVWVPNPINIQGDIAAYSPALNSSGNRNSYIYT